MSLFWNGSKVSFLQVQFLKEPSCLTAPKKNCLAVPLSIPHDKVSRNKSLIVQTSKSNFGVFFQWIFSIGTSKGCVFATTALLYWYCFKDCKLWLLVHKAIHFTFYCKFVTSLLLYFCFWYWEYSNALVGIGGFKKKYLWVAGTSIKSVTSVCPRLRVAIWLSHI